MVAETSWPGMRGKETMGFNPRKEFRSLPQRPTIRTFKSTLPLDLDGSRTCSMAASPGLRITSAFMLDPGSRKFGLTLPDLTCSAAVLKQGEVRRLLLGAHSLNALRSAFAIIHNRCVRTRARPNAGSMPCADKHKVERPVFEDSLERPISLADGDCSGLV